jgi:hypothetical protein
MLPNEKSGNNLEVGIMAKRTRRSGFAEGGQSAYSPDPETWKKPMLESSAKADG